MTERLCAVYWERVAAFLSNADVPRLLRACPAAWRETRDSPLPVRWNGKRAPPPRRCPVLRELTFEGAPLHAWGGEKGEKSKSDGSWGTFKVRITRLPIRPGAVPRLRALCVTNTQIRDIKPLRHCPLLEDLRCDYTPLNSLEGLEGCARLRVLHCGFTHVMSLRPLADHRELEELSVHHTQARSLAPLRRCTALRRLRAGHAEVADLDGLQGCAKLRELDLPTWSPQITNIEPIRACTALRRLNLNIESRLRPYSLIFARPVELNRGAVEVLRALRRVRDLRVVGYALDAARLLLPLSDSTLPELRRLQCSAAPWEVVAEAHVRGRGGRLTQIHDAVAYVEWMRE